MTIARRPWAADVLTEWYPGGRNDPAPEVTGDLLRLANDPAASGIMRATAVSLLGLRLDVEGMAQLYPMLDDPDPLVRRAAVDALRFVPYEVRVALLVPRTADPVRSVRVAAALVTMGLPANAIPKEYRDAVDTARGEAFRMLSAVADFPEGADAGGRRCPVHALVRCGLCGVHRSGASRSPA